MTRKKYASDISAEKFAQIEPLLRSVCRRTKPTTVDLYEVTDRQGTLQALRRCRPGLQRVQRLLADSGYVGQPFAQGVRDILGEPVTVQIAKRSQLHTFKVMPKRWVVIVAPTNNQTY